MDLSVVFPVFNERPNLPSVYRETHDALAPAFETWELIFVDDGSTDGSYELLCGLAASDDRVSVVRLAANFGQSAALDAGIRRAAGDVVVTMDADGQNDPGEIPRLVETLEAEDYDCVVGWRRDRVDPLSKTVASKTAYVLRRFLLNTDLHDYGCTLKAMRREPAQSIRLTGEMHRYIPPLLVWRGYDVGEVEVNHRPRRDGETKYGLWRLPKGFLDMLNVWFWQRYSSRPLHVFGGLGLVAGTIGIASGLYAVFLKLAYAVSLSDTALPLFAAFACLLGIQFFISGILADIGIKNYYAVSRTDAYRVATVVETPNDRPASSTERAEPAASRVALESGGN